jgi:hypothetical protein
VGEFDYGPPPLSDEEVAQVRHLFDLDKPREPSPTTPKDPLTDALNRVLDEHYERKNPHR